ncbi:MAG: FtsQ-type POTRA domain-containing protein [Candidatus Anaerobiospirillum pullicola]|uniref:Cell division protein FtsQ n=1 Tax=Candidatus Anaerobiospirillum pullicola TaxID=2838451 RepID=A0A948WZ28_9GAMM|nr:FtsQ-type POTRA domain-containing protein [Candidatus Anaerobiospirillum pullicola]
MKQKRPGLRRRRRSRGSFLISLLFFLCFCALLTAGYYSAYKFLTDPHTFPVARVTINAKLQHVTQEEIAQEVGKMVGGKNIVTLDLSALHNALLQMPWVAQVSVNKRFPDTIEVSLVEHFASARWKTSGLYDARTGTVFYPDMRQFHGALVTLSAPHDSLAKELYEHAYQFISLTRNTPYLVEEVHLDAARSYRLRLKGDVWVILGRESSPDLPLIRLKRFLLAFGETHLALSDVAYVDMRYDNGFAVGERSAISDQDEADASGGAQTTVPPVGAQ